MSTMVGKVTRERYDELVADGLKQIAAQGQIQLRLDDYALGIEPMNPHGGGQAGPDADWISVRDSLALYAEDLDIAVSTFAGQAVGRLPLAQAAPPGRRLLHRAQGAGLHPRRDRTLRADPHPALA